MSELDAAGDVNRFGSVAFYAALGKAFVTMCAVIPVLFAIEVLDFATGHELDQLGGVRPRQLDGLDGVVFAPLLHASFAHLYGNSVPLLLTGTFVLATGTRRFLAVTGLVALVSGLGAWFTGPSNTVGIGASGVVFGYLGFLLVRGVVERNWWSIAVSLLIGLLFGWTLVGALPTDQHISWQAHLFGLIGGAAAAILFRRRRVRPPPPTAGLTEPFGLRGPDQQGGVFGDPLPDAPP
jgi:membrane associated rhomboid family serine protease